MLVVNTTPPGETFADIAIGGACLLLNTSPPSAAAVLKVGATEAVRLSDGTVVTVAANFPCVSAPNATVILFPDE